MRVPKPLALQDGLTRTAGREAAPQLVRGGQKGCAKTRADGLATPTWQTRFATIQRFQSRIARLFARQSPPSRSGT